MSSVAFASISSPCVQICTLDAAGVACLGCGRSIDEISRWTILTSAEKLEILARIFEQRSASLPTLSEGTDQS
ncbi:MAG: DUF1289 domain-containing protein [Beijerinckiaceae bacterium]|jgi:uncharacterized protein|nr:DUF1289 domain-containing protein [Beijerinckiaceae bacterium]MDO9439751.1 DUF1289 domain-containing protein [Beijerinckiaceae bacterium]